MARGAQHAPTIWSGCLALAPFFAETAISSTLLPFYVDQVMLGDRGWVGLAFTVQYAGATVGLFASGVLADRIGPRRTMLGVMLANAALLNVQGRVRSLGALLTARLLLGLTAPYALGLTWVAAMASPARLARWMSTAIVIAQASTMIGGFTAGALRGRDLSLACGALSAVPALVAASLVCAAEPSSGGGGGGGGGGASGRAPASAGLRLALRSPHFLAVALCPLVQGMWMGGFSTLVPLLLKEDHGWGEGDIGRIFQAGGAAALVSHAIITPYLSGRPWRCRAVQGLSLLIGGAILALGFLGEASAPAAMALSVMAFVATAVSMGCANLMVAVFARRRAPSALGALTGLTRCLFTLGYCAVPAAIVPLRRAGGLILPCATFVGLFAALALVLQAAATPPDLQDSRPAPPEDGAATPDAGDPAAQLAAVEAGRPTWLKKSTG